MTSRILLIGAILTCLLQIGYLLSGLPLGITGEWVWSRVPAGSIDPFGLIVFCFWMAGYALFVIRGARSANTSSTRLFLVWLVGLWLFGAVMLWNLRSIPQGIYGSAGLTWVTYYPRMSGYFTQATETEQSLTEILAGYEQTVRDGDYLHQGTHPPGLPVYFRIGLLACQNVPGLNHVLLATEPFSVSQGTDVLAELAQLNGNPFPPEYRGLLWGNLLLTYLLTAAVVFPLLGLLRYATDNRTAWWLVSLWPFCPGLALFMPKSDLLLTFLCASFVYLFVVACRHRGAVKQLALGVSAGFVAWCALLVSLASLVVIVMLGLWLVSELLILIISSVRKSQDELRPVSKLLLDRFPVLSITGALMGLAVPILVCGLLFDLNLLAVWQINLSQHAEFYEHNPRTYWKWLLINPLELGFSLGAPLSWLAMCGLWNVWQIRSREDTSRLVMASSLTITLLWLSGKNMGEAARLWLFLLPFCCLWAGQLFNRDRPLQEGHDSASAVALSLPTWGWLTLLMLQALVAGVTVTTVDGFDFTYFSR